MSRFCVWCGEKITHGYRAVTGVTIEDGRIHTDCYEEYLNEQENLWVDDEVETAQEMYSNENQE